MIRLFQNIYQDPNTHRNDELMVCYADNRSNPDITEFIELPGRPTFSEIFEEANRYAGEDDISIFCNSDIMFDHTLPLVRGMGLNDVYALSRWDLKEDGSIELFDREDSQDCYIWRGRLRKIEDCNFKTGTPGSDNAIVERFDRCGYNVTNPSLTIHAIHLHLSGIRTHGWRNPCSPPYKYLQPTTL